MSEVCATQILDGVEDCHNANEDVPDINRATTAENGSQGHSNGDESLIWGRLLSVNDVFPSVALQKDTISIGRGSSCDVRLASLKRSQQISTHHFTLLHMPNVTVHSGRSDSSTSESNGDSDKVKTNGNGDCGEGEEEVSRRKSAVSMATVLRDHSTNGTFVDGVKIGKDKQVLLLNNQVISLLSPSNRCWMFTAFDSSDFDEAPKLPASIADRFVVSKQLGEGGFGRVYLAYEIGTCEPCAIKVMNKRNMLFFGNVSEIDRAIQTQEVKNLVSIKHPNIIRVLEFINETDNAFIILEYMAGGDLHDKIEECKTLTEAQAKHIGYQLANAISYLHENDITHRDIKPENVLLVDKSAELPTVKLTDFGLSKLLHRGTVLRTVCGTAGYTAPEIDSLEDDQSYTNKCDVWSLGALIFACLFGRDYNPDSDAEMLALATASDKNETSTAEAPPSPADATPPVAVSPSAASLLLAMLEPLPERRLAMGDVVAHDWFAECRLAAPSTDAVDADANAVADATGDISTVSEEDAAGSKKLTLSLSPTLAVTAAPAVDVGSPTAPKVSARARRVGRPSSSAATSFINSGAGSESGVSADSPTPPTTRSSRRKRGRREVDVDQNEAQEQLGGGGVAQEAAAAALLEQPESPVAKRRRGWGWGCALL